MSSVYSAPIDADAPEVRAKRMALELRSDLRSLALTPFLTPRWIETAEKLSVIGHVTELERKAPGGGGSSSLWDGQEHTLRFILEDGMVNLLIRMLHEYVTAFRDHKSPLSTYELAACYKFEYGIGAALSNAWQHPAPVITSDLGMVTEVISIICSEAKTRPPIHKMFSDAVAAEGGDGGEGAGAGGGGGGGKEAEGGGKEEEKKAAEPPTTDAIPPATPSTDTRREYISTTIGIPRRSLEAYVGRMIGGFAKVAAGGGSQETRIIQAFLRGGIFTAVFTHLSVFSDLLSRDDVLEGCVGLSKLIATEEFGTNKGALVSSPDIQVVMSSLKPKVLDPFAKDLSLRKEMRSLIDFAGEVIRKAGRR